MGELEDLSESECRGLLAERSTGRVAVVAPDGPHIITVNYSVVDETVVIRTTPLTLLATYAPGTVVAFQVDHTDNLTRTGWSIQARGPAAIVEDEAELSHIVRTWQPTPWAEGVRNLYLRVRFQELSGRRVGLVAEESRVHPDLADPARSRS